MIFGKLFLIFLGGSYGLLSAAGVFTALAAVGLVPRFAGRSHTAGRIYLYEEMVILGAIIGCFVSVFPELCTIGAFLQNLFPGKILLWKKLGEWFLGGIGLFSGMFIGCLALAIAEMLDSIPIFARRVSFRSGFAAAIFSIALGKLAGSMFYFWTEFHITGG